MIPTDVQIEESRKRLKIPDDFEWYECANECGDIAWVPPGVGDSNMMVTCSPKCVRELMEKIT